MLLKTIKNLNGTLIAYRRVPVMNRLLGESRPAQNREDPRQEQTPMSGPQKRDEPAGKVSINVQWIKTLHTINLGGQCP
jgi:hypothetical protein